jgi:hypothetical protein
VAEPAIDAALGNDAKWITQSIVVTREFFRLVFALIAPQNNHQRLSRRIAGKATSFANNIVTALSLCAAKIFVGKQHRRPNRRIQNAIAELEIGFVCHWRHRNAHESRFCEDAASGHA